MKKQSKTDQWTITPKTFLLPLTFLMVFYTIAVTLWLKADSIFYLFNFMYIGTSIALAIFLMSALPKRHKSWGRRVSQILVGTYMLVYLGFISKENMQLEGFFTLFLAGIFAGATLHYIIAKIIGPILFGRGWCSYACWTAMILDLLPYKNNPKGRLKYWGALRYIHFVISLMLILFLTYILNKPILSGSDLELVFLIIGNLFYYLVGISLAFILKDNRAFCKYVCPIPVFQKVTSRFSLLKVKIDENKCIDCHLCEKACPMDIKLLDYKSKQQRILSTECIWCSSCQLACPKGAISSTIGFDASFKENLNYKK